MSGQELMRREENVFELGKVFAESGMFPSVRQASEAIVKIMAGREFGLGPMAAMNGIHMVDGKPTLAANLIAGQIKRHPLYDYKVVRRDETGCELEFSERTSTNLPYEPVGRMTFEKKDAEKAGLLGKQNWRKYPRDMYFARCLTAGARTYCPDVLGGSPVYTAEELGADEGGSFATGGPVAETQRFPAETGPETLQQPISAAPTLEPEEEVTDAVVVEEKPESATVDKKVVRQLFDLCNQHSVTPDRLAWSLLSVGVQTLPENPTKEQLRAAVEALTIEQAFKLEEILSNTDGGTPGSGETA